MRHGHAESSEKYILILYVCAFHRVPSRVFRSAYIGIYKRGRTMRLAHPDDIAPDIRSCGIALGTGAQLSSLRR